MDSTDYQVMGIDFGTQSVRVGIYDRKGKYIAGGDQNYSISFPKVGWAEQDPNEWWTALKNLLKRVLDGIEVKKIKGIAVCGTSSTVVPVDQSGDPMMNAIMWMDTRNSGQVKRINDQKHEILKLCGGEVSSEWMVPKALWIKEEMNEMYKDSFKIVEQIDWINYKLTGKWTASICNTTCKWNLGLDKKWDMGFFNSIGLEDIIEKWPEDIKDVGEEVGLLTHNAAKELGLNEGTAVFEGAIDAYVCMLGMGVGETKKLSLTMGTSFVQLAFIDKPTFSGSLWGPYQDVLIKDYAVLEAGQLSCASLIEWFIKEFIGNYDKNENIYTYLVEKGRKIEPGSEGIVALDFFQGSRTPYKDSLAKGQLYGLTLKHTKWHIYRALLEATAFGNLNNIKEMESAGCRIDEIVACGGGTKNSLWLQIIADVCNRQIKVPKSLTPGILGCAIVALKGLNEYKTFSSACDEIVEMDKIIYPNEKNNKIYEQIFDEYIYLYEKLKDLMQKKH